MAVKEGVRKNLERQPITIPRALATSAARSTLLRQAVTALRAAAAALRAAGYPPGAAVLREIDATVAIESQRLPAPLRWRRVGTLVSRRGLRITYETDDGRFRIVWEDLTAPGAGRNPRGGWVLKNVLAGRSLRAASLNDAKEAAMEIARAAEPVEVAS